MKTFYTLLLLCFISFTVKAQQISLVEYFYDTDPGFGNGTSIGLSNESVDITLQFSITGLSAGIHTLYVRLKNTDNKWSTVYQNVFLLTSGTGGSTSFAAGEYFFDTDPGIGNGMSIPVNGEAIDSVINFDVSTLQPGVHTFYVRFKNSSNSWSFTNQGNFVLFKGSGGAAQIQTLNYFIDTVGNTLSLPLHLSASLDTIVSINIPDNGASQRILGTRLATGTGQLSNATLDAISLCDLYKPEAGFRLTQYASTFNMIDTSKFNTSKKISWLINGTAIDSNYSTTYIFPNGAPGSKILQQVAGTGCRVDTVTKVLSMPGVETFSPTIGSYGADVQLDIYGNGLDSTLDIYLVKGDTIVRPYLKIPQDNYQHLITVFDFHPYPLTYGTTAIVNNYDLHVVYPGNQDIKMATPVALVQQEDNIAYRCFALMQAHAGGGPYESDPRGTFVKNPADCRGYTVRVQDPDYIPLDTTYEPYIATNLTGPSAIRTGFWNDFTMSITNTGTIVARGIPFFIMVPANFDIDTTQWNVINTVPGLRDSISVITDYDTVIDGRHLQYKLIAMIYPVLAPGQTGYFPLRIRTTLTQPYHIYYTAMKRMFGSPMTNIFGPCYGAVADFAIGFIPGVSCVYAFYNGLFDLYNFNARLGNNTWRQTFSFGLSMAGTAVSCIPGGGPLKQIASAGAKEMGITKALLGEAEQATNVADKGLNLISTGNNLTDPGDPCSKANNKPNGLAGSSQSAFDPNYITGNSDYDAARHYINNYSPQHYTIGFENKPSASANAQHVFITDTLNVNKFIIPSFTLSSVSIGDSTYGLPGFRQSIVKDFPLPNRKDMKLRFVANFDTASGVLRADFFSIDTSGHVLRPDSLDGFLPPDADGISGTGKISYSVYAQNLNTLDTFSNKASIYFDNNTPVVTNTWVNIIDTTRPGGYISKAIMINDSTAKLVMGGIADIGSGVHYTTFYSKSSTDSLFRKMGEAVGDTVIFTGKPNETYQFFSKSADNVGNLQKKDSVADITFTLSSALPVHLLSFTGKKEAADVKLQWTTTNELNFSHYEAEKSADGRSFKTMATVKAKGSQLKNDYLLYDANPYPQSNYYRLKEVDIDGKFIYSNTVKIDFSKSFTVNVTPVPAHDYIIIEGAQNFKQIQLIDMSGRVVKQFSTPVITTFNIADIPAGIYLVRLLSDADSQVLKMVKQ